MKESKWRALHIVEGWRIMEFIQSWFGQWWRLHGSPALVIEREHKQALNDETLKHGSIENRGDITA